MKLQIPVENLGSSKTFQDQNRHRVASWDVMWGPQVTKLHFTRPGMSGPKKRWKITMIFMITMGKFG